MARLAIALIVGLLSLSVSGLSSLMTEEPCTGYELTGQGEDDGACPPTCVTCGCCAQAAEAPMFAVAIAPDTRIRDVSAVVRDIPLAEPRDILHVPKRSLT